MTAAADARGRGMLDRSRCVVFDVMHVITGYEASAPGVKFVSKRDSKVAIDEPIAVPISRTAKRRKSTVQL